MPTVPTPLAVVLAGGLGKRIRHVLPDVPKPLAPVAGRPFLEWVLRYLHTQGVRRVALSTGYRADRIDDFSKGLRMAGLSVSCVRESVELGTAGALVHTLKAIEDAVGDVLVCNGDSLALTSLDPLFAALRDSDAGAVIMGVSMSDASRYGTLQCSPDGALMSFHEKTPGAGLVNAGVYLLRRIELARFPDRTPLSFEYDVFPTLLRQGVRITAIPCECPFIDIGTAASLAQADSFIQEHRRWFA